MIRTIGLAFAVSITLIAGCGSKPRVAVTTSAQGDQIELSARVKTALLNDPIVGKRRIDVHADGADIRLTGRVASAAERDRAVSLARAVEGVRTATSDLQIQP